jgi:hypothetical protein
MFRNLKITWKSAKRSSVSPRKKALNTFIIGGRAGNK